MALDEFVEKRLQELAQERVEALETLETVRESIKAADAKRAAETDTEHYQKWGQILRTLEAQLDRAKTRLASIDAEIEEKAQKPRELQQKAGAKEAQGVAVEPGPSGLASHDAVEAAGLEALVDLEPADAAAGAPEDRYRVALRKVSSGPVGALTLAEFESLVEFYEGLLERPETDRVRLAVLKAMLKANSEYERVRAKAAACVRAERTRPGGDDAQATA